MPDQTDDFLMTRRPSPERPLQGQTVLVVEDSRFASEALRLLCLRSGARIRRADCIRAAARHLAAYRPSVAIVDLGLPDGSGLDLLARIAAMTPRVPVVLGTSADDTLADAAIAAGADGFLGKPVTSIAVFQQAILRHVPPEARPRGVRAVIEDRVEPDEIALSDDLSAVAERLNEVGDARSIGYIAQFLDGVAKTSGDPVLGSAAQRLRQIGSTGRGEEEAIAFVSDMISSRLRQRRAI